MDVIDTKASALLAHLSIFAAVAGILLGQSDPESNLRLLLLGEFISLLVLAIICLRCLRMLLPSDVTSEDDIILRQAMGEMLYRRKIYIFAHEASGLVTIFLIGTAIFIFANV